MGNVQEDKHVAIYSFIHAHDTALPIIITTVDANE
jgi:hypothetical protein|tara:strand:+ start:877 stop:981 length:105 start_codon:yes stop_codon:yes gene_type:complete